MRERDRLISGLGLVADRLNTRLSAYVLKDSRTWGIRKIPLFLLAFLFSFLVFATTDGFAAPVAIQNPSFEDNVPEDGDWESGAEGTWIRDQINGWTVQSESGVFRPSAIPCPSGVPEGLNVAYLGASTISQTLTESLTEGYKYTLIVYVGHRADNNFRPYRVQLYAGENLLAEDNNSLSPEGGEFLLSTVQYIANPGDSNTGQQLEIRLLGENATSAQVLFDRVTLDASPLTLNDGLVAYYPFNGNANDASGNGNNGTVYEAILSADRFGNSNSAYSFDGVNDYVGDYSTEVFDNFTISLWVNPINSHQIDTESTSGAGGTSGQYYVISPVHYGDTGNSGAGISVGTNGVSVYEHSSNYMPALLVWQGGINGWTHLVVTYVDKQPFLYVNGSLVKTGLTSTKNHVYGNNSSTGGYVYGYFEGMIDDIRVYNRVLLENEIHALYEIGDNAKDADSDNILDDGNNSGTIGDRRWSPKTGQCAKL